MTSRSNLRSHLATHGTFDDQQLKSLEDAGGASTYNLTARDCPLCDERADKLKRKRDEEPHRVASGGVCQDIFINASRFKRHVATHQEQLAIFAIPRATRDEIEHGEGSIISSTFGNGLSCIAADAEEQGSPVSFRSSEKGITPNEHEITSEEIPRSEKPPLLDRLAEDFPWEISEVEDDFSALLQNQETQATGQESSERRHLPGFPRTTTSTPSPGPVDSGPAHLDYSRLEQLQISVTDYPQHDMSDEFVAGLNAGLVEGNHGGADLALPPQQNVPDGFCTVRGIYAETTATNWEFGNLSAFSTSSAVDPDQRSEFQCQEPDCKRWFKSNRDFKYALYPLSLIQLSTNCSANRCYHRSSKHKRAHDKPFCCEADENCLFRAAWRRDLNRHYYVTHYEYGKERGIFKDVTCGTCGRKFMRRDHLTRHQRRANHPATLRAEEGDEERKEDSHETTIEAK
jgi:hypothetical protein